MRRLAALFTMCLAASGCAFDDSGDFFAPDTGGPAEPDDPTGPTPDPADPGPGTPTPPDPGPGPGDDPGDPGDPGGPGPGDGPIFFATSEETRHGELLAGSYLDSHQLDGVVESIGGEISRGDERLEHDWYIEGIPAGAYDITLVLAGSAPRLEAYEIEYNDGGRGHKSLFLLPGDGELQMYEGTVMIDGGDLLELRAKLDKVEAERGELPASLLEVDYLALRPTDR